LTCWTCLVIILV